MQRIKELVDHIDEELCGAKEYAECYLTYKAKGNSTYANKYKEMATDELKHSNYLHEIAITEIEELNRVYTPPVEMEEEWDKSHKRYIEKAAWIKQMLAM